MIKDLGQVPEEEMRRVFNLGIGFIFVIEKKYIDRAMEILHGIQQEPVVIGEVI